MWDSDFKIRPMHQVGFTAGRPWNYFLRIATGSVKSHEVEKDLYMGVMLRRH